MSWDSILGPLAQLHANARCDYLKFAAGKLKFRRMRKVIESVSPNSHPPPLPHRELAALCSPPHILSQFNEHITGHPSCGTATTAFQQVIGESLRAWTRSSHVERLMVEEAPNNERTFRESPRDSPKALRRSEPSLSTCFSKQSSGVTKSRMLQPTTAQSSFEARAQSLAIRPTLQVPVGRKRKGYCAEMLPHRKRPVAS